MTMNVLEKTAIIAGFLLASAGMFDRNNQDPEKLPPQPQNTEQKTDNSIPLGVVGLGLMALGAGGGRKISKMSSQFASWIAENKGDIAPVAIREAKTNRPRAENV